MPLTGGDLLLTAQGNFATLSADKANNYLAYGVTGSGGGGGGPGGPLFADDGVTMLLADDGTTQLLAQ